MLALFVGSGGLQMGGKSLKKLADPIGFEPTTFAFGGTR
jgi:hypothetical protein